MAVILNRSYGGFAAGATATFDASTEAALVQQSLAAYTTALTLNPPISPLRTGQPSAPIEAGFFGPAVVTNIPIGNVVLTSLDTGGTALGAAWRTAITEIWVPHWNTWTGAAVLNGTGLTDAVVYYLWNTEGELISNTAIAGTAAGSASVFQKIAWAVPVTLIPGRYFLGFQAAGVTSTPRRVIAAWGAEPRCAEIATVTSFAAALLSFQTARITVPTTFTTAIAPIMQLYS
jgi:hypothetical protein